MTQRLQDNHLLIPAPHDTTPALVAALAIFDSAAWSSKRTEQAATANITTTQMSVKVAQILHIDHQYGPFGELDGLYNTSLHPQGHLVPYDHYTHSHGWLLPLCGMWAWWWHWYRVALWLEMGAVRPTQSTNWAI